VRVHRPAARIGRAARTGSGCTPIARDLAIGRHRDPRGMKVSQLTSLPVRVLTAVNSDGIYCDNFDIAEFDY
jgi:hypothetical protein